MIQSAAREPSGRIAGLPGDGSNDMPCDADRATGSVDGPGHSHSMVPGGFEVMS
ncbi:hypothetical protein BH23PSE1_BH23PSE1_17920 [soil metagenome]